MAASGKKLTGFAFAIILGAHTLFPQSLPGNGSLFSIHELGSGEVLFGTAFHPAALAFERETQFAGSGFYVFPSKGSGYAFAAALGSDFPGPNGVLGFSAFANLSSSDIIDPRWGGTGSFSLSFGRPITENWAAGVSANLLIGYGGSFDVGAGLSLGILARSESFLGFTDVEAEAGIALLGKPFLPVLGSVSFPAFFTPVIRAKGLFFRSGIFSGEACISASVPSFSDFLISPRINFHVGSISLSLLYDFEFRRLFFSGGGMNLVPSLSLSFEFPLRFASDEAIDGNDMHKVGASLASKSFFEGSFGLGAAVFFPMRDIDTVGPEISVDLGESSIFSALLKDSIRIPLRIHDSAGINGAKIRLYGPGASVVWEKNFGKNFGKEMPVLPTSFFEIRKSMADIAAVEIPFIFGGTPLPDGLYALSVEAEDLYGNISGSRLLVFRMDSTPPSIQAVLPESLEFSPNGDGNKDELPLGLEGSSESRWQIQIFSKNGDMVRSILKENSRPGPFSWDGKDDSGRTVDDGAYSVTVLGTDEAGNVAKKTISGVQVNAASTPLGINIQYKAFSPNGDGIKDSLEFYPIALVKQGLLSWRFIIEDEAGLIKKTISGSSENLDVLPARIVFNGYGDSGSKLEDGKYRVVFSANYRNGNSPQSFSPYFAIDTKAPLAKTSAEATVFSPTGDRSKSSLKIEQSGFEETLWIGAVSNMSGERIRNYSWQGYPPAAIYWDGRDDTGSPMPDGVYEYTLSASDEAGNAVRTKPIRFSVNTENAALAIFESLSAFSPNGDGKKDSISFFITSKNLEGLEKYTFKVLSETGETVFESPGKDILPPVFTWNGNSNAGKKARDGTYKATLELYYAKGNTAKAVSNSFELDTRYPEIRVDFPYIVFSPNGDGKRDRLIIKQASSTETVWESSMINSEGRAVRSFTFPGMAPNFEWDGSDDFGNFVPDGTYLYKIGAVTNSGNAVSKEFPGILIDSKVPSVFVRADKIAFSPNGDGLSDTLRFDLYAERTTGIEKWSFDIKDAKGNSKTLVSGIGSKMPENLVWDGKIERRTASDGVYSAVYEISYTKGDVVTAVSKQFSIDTTAPEVTLEISPKIFSPDGDGKDDTILISMSARDENPIFEWIFKILDSKGSIVAFFSGAHEANAKFSWNGTALNGDYVESASKYPYDFVITDIVGNSTKLNGIVKVDVLTLQDEGRAKIRISSIEFGASSDQVYTEDSIRSERNRKTIERIVQMLREFPEYRIRLEGHSALGDETDPDRLSQKRAEAVRSRLILEGINASRLDISGLGTREPIFPYSDELNRWKNRRVEFVLLK